MSRNISSASSLDTYETCRTKESLFGEQGQGVPMAGKVSLSEDMPVRCVSSWMGELLDSCPVANSSPPLLHSLVGMNNPPTTSIL